MAIPNSLEVECSSCKVAPTCPSKGSSPLMKDGKRVARCRLIGGYGRTPVEDSILSSDSLLRKKHHGGCLTLAEVPEFDGSDRIIYTLLKIFSPANLHPREKTSMTIDSIYPRSHKS